VILSHGSNQSNEKQVTTISHQGVWKSRGYGWLLELQQSRYSLYDITDHSCVEFESGSAKQFEQGFEIVSYNDDVIVLQVHADITRYGFDRIESLPADVLKLNHPRNSDPELNFEVLWHTFNQDYAFFDRHQVDWQKTYDKYRHQIDQRTSDEQLMDIFKLMLAPLKDNHVHLYGMGLSFTADKNAHAKAVFKSAFNLETAALGNSRTVAAYHSFVFEKLLGGEGKVAGNQLFTWGFVRPGIAYLNVMRLFGIANTPQAKMATGLPEPRHEFAAFLADDLAAVALILDQIMEDVADANALILDIRVNGGGFDKIGMKIANRFADRKRLAFTKHVFRGGPADPIRKLNVTPEGQRQFTKPVYMLASQRTASAGEILAMCMSTLPHVTFVGEPTLGIFSDDLAKHLPNGWKVSISNEFYAMPDGSIHESDGLPPQVASPKKQTSDLAAELQEELQFTIALINSTNRDARSN